MTCFWLLIEVNNGGMCIALGECGLGGWGVGGVESVPLQPSAPARGVQFPASADKLHRV